MERRAQAARIEAAPAAAGAGRVEEGASAIIDATQPQAAGDSASAQRRQRPVLRRPKRTSRGSYFHIMA